MDGKTIVEVTVPHRRLHGGRSHHCSVLLLEYRRRTRALWLAMDDWLVWIGALTAAAAIFVLPGVLVETAPGASTLTRALSRWLYPYGGTSDHST